MDQEWQDALSNHLVMHHRLAQAAVDLTSRPATPDGFTAAANIADAATRALEAVGRLRNK